MVIPIYCKFSMIMICYQLPPSLCFNLTEKLNQSLLVVFLVLFNDGKLGSDEFLDVFLNLFSRGVLVIAKLGGTSGQTVRETKQNNPIVKPR